MVARAARLTTEVDGPAAQQLMAKWDRMVVGVGLCDPAGEKKFGLSLSRPLICCERLAFRLSGDDQERAEAVSTASTASVVN